MRILGGIASPDSEAAAGLIGGSSTQIDLRGRGSLSRSGDDGQITADTTKVPGQPALVAIPGRSRSDQAGKAQ